MESQGQVQSEIQRRSRLMYGASRTCAVLTALLILLLEPLSWRGALSFAQEPTSPAGKPEAYLDRLRATSRIAPSNELRALWVVRHALTDLESVDRLIEFAAQMRFHLLFVQVRGRGDAYYKSSTEPPGPDLKAPLDEFDPFAYLLTRARQSGISVHAWINVFYVWSDGNATPPETHVVREHPEWLLSDPAGVNMGTRNVKWWQNEGLEGYYLSPTEPAVRDYIAGVVSELVTSYPVDGVHLDYVRYPNRRFGLDPVARTDFALDWGIDPVALDTDRRELEVFLGASHVARLDSIHTWWRAAAVDSMVRAIRGVTGDLALSAAVIPYLESAREDKGQDWPQWVYDGIVDFVVPMLYSKDVSDIVQRTRSLHRAVGKNRVLPGLALHDGRDATFLQTVGLLRQLGVTGISVFSYNVIAETRFSRRLIERAFFSVSGEPGEP